MDWSEGEKPKNCKAILFQARDGGKPRVANRRSVTMRKTHNVSQQNKKACPGKSPGTLFALRPLKKFSQSIVYCKKM